MKEIADEVGKNLQDVSFDQNLLNDSNTFGLLFETMAVRDLCVYADSLGGDVYHFRDKEGLECDAVVHLRNCCPILSRNSPRAIRKYTCLILK